MHTHDDHEVSLGPLPPAVRRRLLLVLVPFILLTLVGVGYLWPSQDVVPGTANLTADTVTGTVKDIHGCPAGMPAECVMGTVELTDDGQEVEAGLPYGPKTPEVEVGDKIVMAFAEQAPEGSQYVWLDFDRTNPVLVLVLLFIVGVLVLSRWEGLGSLISIGISILVIFAFLLPSLQHGGDPMLTAVTAASVIMITTLYVTYGVNARTSVAVIGTLLALAFTAALGIAFTAAMQFTGLSDESNRVLFQVLPNIEFEGLLLCGLIIGALGVLDDVTVTQAAAVWELAAADRKASRRRLFTSSMRIGRSHVSAAVNTLVLAYSGAALPLLLTYSAVNKDPGQLGLTDAVSQEIVRGLVGSLGIIAAVPITTAVGVAVASAIVHQGFSASRNT